MLGGLDEDPASINIGKIVRENMVCQIRYGNSIIDKLRVATVEDLAVIIIGKIVGKKP